MKNKAPELTHKPVITVDYNGKDAKAGDAKFLSIGRSTWNPEDFSAKIWRWSNKSNRWSRQSEEIPLWRVLDIATLLTAFINNKQSNLDEFVQDSDSVEDFKAYIQDNMEVLAPKLNELSNMLSGFHQIETSRNTPNIFSFATSELSQDAMFAWLIQWADPQNQGKDESLHKTAQSFVRLLLDDADYLIRHISVGRQRHNIDIWSEINDDAFLIIEDKTNTSIHDNQLERYKEIVENLYKGKRDHLFFVYIKTGNEPESILNEIKRKGYKTVSRKDIIDCLNQYSGNNYLILNYLDHLKWIEEETQSFRVLPVSQWGWYAWQGFYKELEKRLKNANWNYVANPAGGFLGAWWHFVSIPNIDGEMYLQFEQNKLCFKINYRGKSDSSKVRNEQHIKLLALADEKNLYEIKRPTRFGAGRVMSIAIVNPVFLFGEDIVNLDELVNKLLEYQSLIDQCCKE